MVGYNKFRKTKRDIVCSSLASVKTSSGLLSESACKYRSGSHSCTGFQPHPAGVEPRVKKKKDGSFEGLPFPYSSFLPRLCSGEPRLYLRAHAAPAPVFTPNSIRYILVAIET